MTKLLERFMWLPGDDPDSLLLPAIDRVDPEQYVMRYRSLQDAEFRKEIRREFWRSERGALNLPLGPFNLQVPVTNRAWPQFAGAVANTPVTVTPTALGATTGRTFPFTLDAATQVGKIYVSSSSAVASSFQLGIFASNGSQKYNSGTQGTSANITAITPTAFKMMAGLTNYLIFTNANLTSATAAYIFTVAFSATIARWGTVAVTSGALPASINPASAITATVGGFPLVVIGAV